MMEREQIRTALATKLMGWTQMYLVEYDTDVWMEPSGEDKLLGMDGWLVVEGMYDYRDWRPDEDWKQCGMVIEAMREKGWCWDGSFTDDEDGVWCSWWRVTDDGDVSDDTSFSGVGDTFCEAVCYVAALALEAIEGVDMADGAHLGVSAERALATILGGEPSPTKDECMSDEEFAEWIRSAPEKLGDFDYSEASRWLARYYLLALEDGCKAKDAWDVWDVIKAKLPKVAKEEAGEMTGFMHGWAHNAARKILAMPPASNPAILTIQSACASTIIGAIAAKAIEAANGE